MSRRIAIKTVQREDESVSQEFRLGRLGENIVYHLRRAQDASYESFFRSSVNENWQSGQFALLVLIHENPGINQTLLSRILGRDKSSLTSSFRVLEEEKFIIRQRVQSDLRNYSVTLTAKGRDLMDEMHVAADKHEKELHRILGIEDSEHFLILLRRVIDGLTAEM